MNITAFMRLLPKWYNLKAILNLLVPEKGRTEQINKTIFSPSSKTLHLVLISLDDLADREKGVLMLITLILPKL